MLKPETINYLYPITKMDIYGNGLIVTKRSNRLKPKKQKKPGNRRAIKMLSKQSLNRLAFTVLASPVKFQSLATLTYLDVLHDGRECKKHLRQFLNEFTKTFPGIEYLWILEFQARGAPHFHILFDHSKPDNDDRELLSIIWCLAVRPSHHQYCQLSDQKVTSDYLKMRSVHSHKKSWEQIKKEDGARRYMLKYALKPYQKVVPVQYINVGRFWGCSTNVIPDKVVSDIDVTDEEIRALLGDNPIAEWDVLPKYIFPRK